MPFRYQQFHPGFYHVYNRGNDKNIIFRSSEDYGYFIKRMYYYRLQYNIKIICYCLMPNHFHLFIEIEESSSVPNFMKQLQMVYAQYMQDKYEHLGHLFQGRYKTVEVETENQFLYLSAYVHSNPKSAGLVNKLLDWKWSSYLDYIGLRNGKIPNKDLILYYFNSPADYGQWVDTIGEEKLKNKINGLTLEEESTGKSAPGANEL